MRIIRFLGNVALWLGALLGIVAGGVWVADQLGWVQPLIVISGSMEPNIGTGDLLISRNLASADVEVGDVVSLHSEMTDKLVTHRVTEVAPNDDGTWTISMKGDANDEPDLETYVVGDSVLTPALQIPQGGKIVSKLMEPAVALPILLSLVALLGISLLDEPGRPKAGRNRKRGGDALTDDSTGGDSTTHDDPVVDATITTELEPVDVDPIEDLDAALAALGIDVGRLPAVRPRHATAGGPATDDGLDSTDSDPPFDPERRTDERDLVMSG